MKNYNQFIKMKGLNLICSINVLLSLVLLITARQRKPYDDDKLFYPMLMPNVQPLVKDFYLCTAFRMPKNDFKYIVQFTPNASMHVAHHIAIFSCDFPGRWERDTPKLAWNCESEHEVTGLKSGYIRGPICSSGTQIIYTWARDAPPLTLPDGVGFKVGKDTAVKFLVLQVHYADAYKFIKGGKDNSGVILTMLPSTTDKITKTAGIIALDAAGMIRAGEKENFESACRMEEPMKIHPFAFRIHTHALGKVVSGYKIDKDRKWHLIGKHNPQEPQMFYPVKDKNLVIEYGDIMAARCSMYNFRDRDTYVGITNDDEMCIFYMMYYVDGDRVMQTKRCFTSGPNNYYWNRDPNIQYVPKDIDLSASTL